MIVTICPCMISSIAIRRYGFSNIKRSIKKILNIIDRNKIIFIWVDKIILFGNFELLALASK